MFALSRFYLLANRSGSDRSRGSNYAPLPNRFRFRPAKVFDREQGGLFSIPPGEQFQPDRNAQDHPLSVSQTTTLLSPPAATVMPSGETARLRTFPIFHSK